LVRAKVHTLLQRPETFVPRARTVTTLLWLALHASIRPHLRMSHAIHLTGNVLHRTQMVLALVVVKSIQVLTSHVPTPKPQNPKDYQKVKFKRNNINL